MPTHPTHPTRPTRRTVYLAAAFTAAILAGATAGLLAALAYAHWAAADPHQQQQPWPVVYRCGITVQPEDLDRADRCACETCDR